MTALPQPPGKLLTIAEYSELGEDDRYRWELQEGNLVMSPSPSPRHMLTSGGLRDQLTSQAPRGVRIIQDIDIDLQLSGSDQPGWSRWPDLVAVEQAAVDRLVSLLAFHLAGDLGYADDGEVTDVFTTTEPYLLTIALDELF